MVLPDLRALEGTSEGTRSVGTLMLSRERKESKPMKNERKESYPEAASNLHFFKPLFGSRADTPAPDE